MRIPSILISLFFLSSCKTNVESKTSYPPNVVIVFTDDQGYQDLGSFGSPNISTPHLDQIAKEDLNSLIFMPQAVCSTSRAGLLTGCYPNRIGISGALFPQQKIGINSQETTLAEMLKSARL